MRRTTRATSAIAPRRRCGATPCLLDPWPVNVAALLHAQATLRPDAPAIIERRGGRTRTTTFAALDRAAAQAAALLRREGLAPGDAALVLHPVSSDLYVALAALLRLGLVAVFLDPSAGRAHVERCCALVP